MAVPKQARESSPTLKMLHQEARSISDDFSKRAAREGLAQWTPADIALGLAADGGELAKLVQRRSGLRPGTVTDAALSDELADCLWSVLVLAEAYGIDLGSSMRELRQRVRSTTEQTVTTTTDSRAVELC